MVNDNFMAYLFYLFSKITKPKIQRYKVREMINGDFVLWDFKEGKAFDFSPSLGANFWWKPGSPYFKQCFASREKCEEKLLFVRSLTGEFKDDVKLFKE